MLIIGSHVSFNRDEQLLGSVKEALGYHANAFMFYTGAPQNTVRCSINNDITKNALKLMDDNGIDIKNVIVHAPYIINLANNESKEKYVFAINFLKDEIRRVESMGIEKLVLHPGSFVNLDLDSGIKNIINALNEVILPTQKVKICLETMAGKGTETCFRLEHIKRIFDGVNRSDMLMVCIDTCHLNDAGYDMNDFDKFLDDFNEIIGIDKIGCVHVNDSKNVIASNKDRHENIGYGTIGFNALLNIIYNEKLKDVPKILETPYVCKLDNKKRSFAPYMFEIKMIKDKKFNDNLFEDVRKYYDK